MNRAGLVFTIAPQSYQVDEDQLLAIQNEPKIKMVEKGKRAYEVGMENPGNSVASVSDVSQTPETPVSDVWNSGDGTGAGEGAWTGDPETTLKTSENDPGDEKWASTDPDFIVEPKEAPEGKKVKNYNKAELFFALNKAGLVAGKDYQTSGSNSLLLQLLELTISKNNPPQ